MQLLRLGQDLVHTDRVELLDPVEHEDTDPHGDHRAPTRPESFPPDSNGLIPPCRTSQRRASWKSDVSKSTCSLSFPWELIARRVPASVSNGTSIMPSPTARISSLRIPHFAASSRTISPFRRGLRWIVTAPVKMPSSSWNSL